MRRPGRRRRIFMPKSMNMPVLPSLCYNASKKDGVPVPPRDRIAEILLDWFDRNRRVLPWRENRTAYGTWVSETMLQQTRVTAVIPYFRRFLERFPDIAKLSEAPLEDVYKAWEGLGYYSRARNLQKGAQYCVRHHRGAVPADYGLLLEVPGIGPYTAGAIASLAFGLPEPAVDGNAIRVFSRLFGLFVSPQDTSARKNIAELVRGILPADRAGDFNEAVMDLGATVCVPRNPDCGGCPLSGQCEANILGKQSELPLKKVRKDSPVISLTIAVIRRDGRIFVRQRPDTGLLAGLFEFPCFDGHIGPDTLRDRVAADFRVPAGCRISVTGIGGAFHTFSHLKWDMDGYFVDIGEDKKAARPLPLSEAQPDGGFYTMTELEKMAFPSALKVYTGFARRLSESG